MILGNESATKIIDVVGVENLDDFATYLSAALYQGVDVNSPYYKVLQQNITNINTSSLEKILEEIEIKIIERDSRQLEDKQNRKNAFLKLHNITPQEYTSIKQKIRYQMLGGKDLQDSEVDFNKGKYQLVVSFIREELASEISLGSKNSRPKIYEGIGLSGKFVEGGFQIDDVFLGSNAAAQGIKPGDTIISTDYKGKHISLGSANFDEMTKIEAMRGQKGVQLYKVLQDGVVKEHHLTSHIQSGVYRSRESLVDQIKHEVAQKQLKSKALEHKGVRVAPTTPYSNKINGSMIR